MSEAQSEERVPGYCALCTSRCGCVSVVRDGRVVAVETLPGHPTGQALCGKGRAAPELVHHEERLLYPLKRTRPKGDPDPGWQRISWDEALGTIAGKLKDMARESGPESVAFGITTPSGTGLQDAYPWVERLRHAYGSPNAIFGTEICNFHRDNVYAFTFGADTPVPDCAGSDCIVLWGHNPSATWLALATRVAEAKARGAKLIVVDPRREGLAVKADQWLRVRPGSDGALALGLAHLLLEEGHYDVEFIRSWSNAPFLVREDEGRLLRGDELDAAGDSTHRVVWDEAAGAPLLYDPKAGAYARDDARPALAGSYEIVDRQGDGVVCRPAFALYRDLCRDYTPERVEALTWVPAADLRATAKIIGEAASVACFTWSGVSQQTNASQTSRAIALLYALTGSFDAPGGNVLLDGVPTADVTGRDLLGPAQAAKAIGLAARPAGPQAHGWITTDDFYRAVLEGEPYPMRGLVSFGSNMLLSHADGARGRQALQSLEFVAHIDMFMTPSAALADIVLPANSPWEREGLCTNFKVDAKAAAYVQLRPAVVPSRGEAKSDHWIVTELAGRLGLANLFWGGDIDAGYRAQLAPSGIDPEELRQRPEGLPVPHRTRHRKYRDAGFATPSRKVEIYSEMLQGIGQAPLPDFVEPATGPISRPDLAERFPLVLTSAKSVHYCHSQHRALPTLRRREPDPQVEIHPETAARRGIAEGDWLQVETPHGQLRGRARLREHLDPRVVSATAGWWQGCSALGLSGFDPLGPESANLNGAIGEEATDPISGSVPLRSYLCEVSALAQG